MPTENENKKKGIFDSLGSYAASAIRVPVGFFLGVTLGSVSFVRATIGTSVNMVKAAVGAVGVVGSVLSAGVSFGCIRAVDSARRSLGLEPLKDRGFLSGINDFNNACKEYTGNKWEAAKNSFDNVFTGKQDEKYKNSILKFFSKFKKPAPAQAEVSDDRESFSSQASTVITNAMDPQYQDQLYGKRSTSSDSRDLETRTSFSGLPNSPKHSDGLARASSGPDYCNSSVDRERQPLLPQGAEDTKKKYDSILSEFSNTGKALTASAQLLFGMRKSKRNEANKNRNSH